MPPQRIVSEVSLTGRNAGCLRTIQTNHHVSSRSLPDKSTVTCFSSDSSTSWWHHNTQTSRSITKTSEHILRKKQKQNTIYDYLHMTQHCSQNVCKWCVPLSLRNWIFPSSQLTTISKSSWSWNFKSEYPRNLNNHELAVKYGRPVCQLWLKALCHTVN